MPDLSRIFRAFVLFFISLLLNCPVFSQVDDEAIDSVSVTSEESEPEEYVFDTITNMPAATRQRPLPDSVYDNLRKDKDYWYVNMAPPRKQPKKSQSSDMPGWMQSEALRTIILILIIAIFLAAIIWFLASSNIKLFESPKKLLNDENVEITEEDLFSINYDNEIRTALLAANYRLATRLWYLRSLKELTEKNLIQYKHEKTNTQYLDELYETRYYHSFSKLTRNFEYAWYGKFELNEMSYKIIEKEFAAFNSNLA
jgi:hypothetical protein